MPKRPTGKITDAGREFAKSSGFSKTGNSLKVRGLTDTDIGGLVEIREDNTKVIVMAIDRALQKALEKVGLVAEGYAKKLCPVDTGRLRNSITHALDGKKSVAVGTNVEYARYVELGTSRRRGTPFLEVAASAHADRYRRIIERELRNS